MSKLIVSHLGGLPTTLGQMTVPVGHGLSVQGDIHQHNDTGAYQLPKGTTAQRPGSPAVGYMRFNTSDNLVEYWNGTEWLQITNASGVYEGPGSENNPATNGQEILNEGLPSGLWWIQPAGQSKYRMYVDNTRNGGGWILCATVRTATCQDHITTASVNISGTKGPRRVDTSTTKMPDSWINGLVSSSTYTGSTRYWLEAIDFNKDMFVSSSATVNLNDSASNENARTIVTLSYQGGLSDRGPNTGTRGFGDHHTSGGTYFAWGRHPESGGNCGFREDTLGASDGYLWVK